MRLLHAIASPRTARSASRQVANAFAEEWKARRPRGSVDEVNVWDTELPAFDGPILEAKYAGIEGRAPDAAQASAWQTVETLARSV